MSAPPDSFSEDAFPVAGSRQDVLTPDPQATPVDEPLPDADRQSIPNVPARVPDTPAEEIPETPESLAEPIGGDHASIDSPPSSGAPFAPPTYPYEPPFERYEYVPPPPAPRRKPDLADCVLFAMLAVGAFFCSGLLMMGALHHHLFGVTTLKQANDDIHYRIGTQAAWYIITLLFCAVAFPAAWRKSFFQGIEWRAHAAVSRIWGLVGAASVCFIAAIVDELVIPGPTNAPIDQTFRMPGAVWLLFAFGVTLAPLIEEIAYRGFLLPALCTAVDWSKERLTGSPRLPLDEDGFPRWSRPAMLGGSVLVSIPFALMHGEQTAYSFGPFLLLVGVSLVLCWVRLAARSLAASVVVHSSYNLLLFALMFVGTGGFRHLDRM